MSDLDRMLDAMRAMPTDARLTGIDGAVIAGVARRREQAMARRSLALAGLLAIGIGWAGTILPAAPAQASPLPIGMSDYAPSRLLGQ
ncbi:hypothetical protein [Sphingobium olei]|uniref:Uncharacterized protein n=1 Tax=Sphingobium olei TaxID=420955 RepID=A0ABW3NYE6_9SPHN|nr:hypothetical protein [Sphingobium sp.]